MKTLIISVFLFASMNIYSQDIISLYKRLADYGFSPQNPVMIKKSINNFLTGKKSQEAYCIKILSVNKKNNYLKAQDPNNEIELRYWNISNGDKLIAFTTYEYRHQHSSVWHFYEYSKNDTIKQLNNDDIIPKPLLTKDEYFDYKKMQEENSIEDYNYLEQKCSFFYKMVLPKNGKNIKIYFKPFLNINLANKIRYKTNYKGIELKWKDGFFVKGKWITK